MPEQLWFTEILNHLFAGPVTGLLRALHVQPQNPEAPITNAVAMQFLVFVSLVVLFALVRSRLSVDRPGALQHFLDGARFIHTDVKPARCDSGIRVAHGCSRSPPGLCHLRICVLPDARIQTRWAGVPEAFPGSDVVAVVVDAAHRDYQPSGTHALADHSSLRQHVCR